MISDSAPTKAPLRQAERLGCYLMPGRSAQSADALSEAVTAERMGLDAVWIAEKYDVKDLPTLAGAIGALTRNVSIGAAVTHPGVRHPMVLASMGQTMQAITGGRFRIGFGRAVPQKWRDYGLAVPTVRSFADLAQLLRRLWAGETVAYDGPLGVYPNLRLETVAGVLPPPLLLAAIGPRMIELSGVSFDGVILHPFLTVDAIRRSADAARSACAASGRDPGAFTVVGVVVVAVDADDGEQERIVTARALRYLRAPGLGESLTAANAWDTAPLAAMRLRGAARNPSSVVPGEWLSASAAAGDADAVRSRLSEYFEAGLDEIIVHGSTARELDGVNLRPVARR
ncbi:MAG TPA: TIGR03857 family LLM class F420-dependent oxidoreductase [Trebonia sp.]|nr:TIGR03857 family LLM class F420-dependent oxidoreductase [Trebonia sp.]